MQCSMMRLVRKYLSLGLVLVLVLTSQSMAVARGAPGPAGQVELCTGTGPVMVYVDETGEPVSAPHHCPDCALCLLLHVAEPDVSLGPAPACHRLFPVRADLQSDGVILPRCTARGPPPII